MNEPPAIYPKAAPLPFRFYQFGIQYTNRCDYKCAHCGTESGGDQPIWNLGTDFVNTLFPVLWKFGFEEITITGGECLLFEEDVKSLVSTARYFRLRTKVISNGSWATTLEKARTMLHSLAESGLDTLTVSFDRFRKPFSGSISQVENIIEANSWLSRNVRIQIYSLETSPDDKEQHAILERLRELIPPDDLFVQRVIPVGRARLLPSRFFTPIPQIRLDKPCNQVFSPFLDHQKQLYRCCSGYDLKKNSPLFLGEVDSATSLETHLNHLREDPLHMALAVFGPSLIFSDAFRNYSGFITLCHFCVEQMGKPSTPALVADFLNQNASLVKEVYKEVEEVIESQPCAEI